MDSLQDLLDRLDPLFLLYTSFVALISFLIAFYYGPKYGKQNVIVYILLCSAVGSLTVMACKGLGLALKDGLELRKWPSYAFLVATVAVCISVQMNYLNKALDLFNASIVTPVYYVLFTTLVIIASAILFKEWKHLSGNDVVGNICGFFVIVVAIVLLHGFKDMDVSLIDIRGTFRPKFEAVVFSSPTHTYGSSVLRSV